MRTAHLAIVCLLAGSPLVGLAETIAPFVFTGPDASKVIGKYMYILEAEDQPLEATEALASNAWVLSENDVPNLGISDQVRWVRFDVVNRSPSPTLVLHIPYPELDHFTVFRVLGTIRERIADIGQALPSSSRSGMHRDMSFDLSIAPGARATLLLRLQSTKQLQIPVTITTPVEYAASRSVRNLFIGGYFGIMMVLALYNLFVFFSIRDRSYLFYVLYILCLCFAQLTLQGVGQAYFWGEYTWFSTKASVLFTLSSMLFAGSFIRYFIDTRRVTPRLDKGLRVLMLAILVTIGLELAGFTLTAYHIAQMLSGSYSLYIIITAVTAIRAGSREARFFLLAWAAFLVGVVAYILKDVGILPLTPMTQYAMPVGSVIEGILLSFGLADRINVLRREKEQSQAAALAASLENQRIVREQNVMLEEKVTQRTQALQESNEHLKRTQTQLVNAEKMASLGQLTAGIAHEINNPINFITSNIQPLRRNISEIVEIMQEYRSLDAQNAVERLASVKERDRRLGIADSIEELDDIIGSISEGSSRTAEIVRGLRNFSRLDEDDLKDADLHEGLRNTLTLLAPQYRDRIDIELDLGDLPFVECFPGKVNQVLMNILTNAIQATVVSNEGPRPVIRIVTRRIDDHVAITIKDHGVGMTEETRSRMFDPFFTTKPVGEGTGLGLAIVYGIVQDHHGHITVESTPGAGTEVRVFLPIRHGRQNERRA